MPLLMKATCEKCGQALPMDSLAFICSYECSFCEPCAHAMNHLCPNCGGELARRPRRKAAPGA